MHLNQSRNLLNASIDPKPRKQGQVSFQVREGTYHHQRSSLEGHSLMKLAFPPPACKAFPAQC